MIHDIDLGANTRKRLNYNTKALEVQPVNCKKKLHQAVLQMNGLMIGKCSCATSKSRLQQYGQDTH